MNSVLEAMRGAVLREIAFGEAAIRLEFSKASDTAWAVFRLKSANLVSASEEPLQDYEEEMAASMPALYRLLGRQLTTIRYTEAKAALTFDNGVTLFVLDQERLWDNLFSVELENKDGRSEFLFGGGHARGV